MCGVFGTVNIPIDLNQTSRHLIHRGPDEQTFYQHNEVQFRHFRLSILDLNTGSQPKHLDNLTIIYNGEIYNHQELRKKHQLLCDTQSDTETILHLYKKLGPCCIKEFDGMFAIAILDKSKNQLFLARDRAGKKPFFYYHQHDNFAFSSELNALKNTIDLEVDQTVIDGYLKSGYNMGDTPYKDVYELPPGHLMIYNIDLNEIKTRSWWSIMDYYTLPKSVESFEVQKTQVSTYLNQGVRRRIDSSDLEVGAFLSGGIDSGLVTAMASRLVDNLKTFTVSFPGAYDESHLAQQVAQKFKTDHHQIHISFDNLENDFDKIIRNYGKPFDDSSAIPSYYVSKAAKEHITVVLNGDGADELFAGYRRYVPFSKKDLFRQSKVSTALFSAIKKTLPLAHNKRSYYNYFYRLVDLLSQRGSKQYFSATTDIFSGFSKEFLNQKTDKKSDSVESFLSNFIHLGGLDKLMATDFHHLLPSLLMKIDIATMAHSLEGRSPFLCCELLEYAPTLPTESKIKGSSTKHILRTIARDMLPPDLHHQPKRGFEIPLKDWINGIFKERINDLLLGPRAYSKNYLNKTFVNNLIYDKVNVSNEKRAKMLYRLLVLELWYHK